MHKQVKLSIIAGTFLAISTMPLFHNKDLTNAEKQLSEMQSQQFVDYIGPKARILAAENNLYASIMIAQAVLESGYGKSDLSKPPYNNLYGVKAGPNYDGPSVSKETAENDKNGNVYYIIDKFKVYSSPEESMKDYVKIFTKTAWYKNYYHGVFKSNTTNYKEATAALTGTYATDVKYEQKLNEIIEQYDLTQYDVPRDDVEIEYIETVYIVKEGDTLFDIANEVSESVTDIKSWNGMLEGDNVTPGQELIIIKTIYKLKGQQEQKKVEEKQEQIEKEKQEQIEKEKQEQIEKEKQEQIKIIEEYEKNKKEAEAKEEVLVEQPIKEELKNQEIIKEEKVIEYKEKKENVAEVKEEKKLFVYIVKNDETLYYIGKKFNIEVEKIKEMNNIKENEVKKGQMIILEENENTATIEEYRVKKGETIYKIAKKYNKTVEELKEKNKMKQNKIKENQILKIE